LGGDVEVHVAVHYHDAVRTVPHGRPSSRIETLQSSPTRVGTETGVRAPSRLEYQPALDGLRGLAVLAVMVMHQHHFYGGFLGVDVFFVLSGFLITSLLLIDRERTGRVISLRFWARRARRLLPAMLVLIVILALYAVVVAGPSGEASLRSGAIAALLYVRNYWGLHHNGTLTTHLWSLSVEEQFYFFWPFILGLLIVVTRRTRWLVVAVLALAVGSAALMARRYLDSHSTFSSYVSTETRAQELLVGAALGIVLFRRRLRGVVLEMAGFVALAALVLLAFTAERFVPTLYQGGFLLVAGVTAVLIAASVSADSPRLRAMLSWRPLVWVGLISYGLYLYHPPLYGFVNAQSVITSEPARIFLRFALVIGVAAASYLLIERPIRQMKVSRGKLLVLTPLATVAVLAALLVSTAGARPATPIELQKYALARAKSSAPSGAVRTMVAGDSLASTFVSRVLPRFDGDGIRGVVEWASHCDVLGGSVALSPDPPSAPPGPCSFEDSYRSAVDSFDPRVSVVVLGPSVLFDRFVDGRRLSVGALAFEEHLIDRLDEMRSLLTAGGATFALTTVPCMTPPTTGEYGGLARIQRDRDRVAAVNGSLRRYAATRDVAIADLGELICRHPEYLDEHGTGLNAYGRTAAWNLVAAATSGRNG
jgi:peptidoglycan/LPS O-acetylase OafA/YrhL